ncbi:MAG: hypothetical protein LBK42_03655 [Propionibacteriaceae bacterium]|jgi:hypothetical protein|nr:hypothetical protein [Propionibacteriaceae bacterium]
MLPLPRRDYRIQLGFILSAPYVIPVLETESLFPRSVEADDAKDLPDGHANPTIQPM